MKTRSYNSPFAVETLEGRNMMSTVGYGDFNNDGRLDKAVLTNPTTITVSLAKADASYKVSATFTTPKNRPAKEITVTDVDSDGDLDINAYGDLPDGSWYAHRWLNNGDGTFGARTSEVFRSKPPKGGIW